MKTSVCRVIFVLPALGILLSFAGCASVSVTSERADGTHRPAGRPTVLYLKDFSFPQQAAIRADRTGRDLAAFEYGLQTSLRTQLVRSLEGYGLPVTVVTSADELKGLRRRQMAWLITGQFTRVNQGSRALRVALGLGAGGTKMETAVHVYDLSQRGREQPLFSFSTTGGSNAEPGILTSVGPLAPTTVPAALVSIAGKGAHGVTEDSKRTARVIAAKISEQLAQRGELPPAHKPGHPKRPGEL
ncbi:MAG TPA: DUF4410 domain-containing protein [Chthoniobacterales bacterium]